MQKLVQFVLFLFIIILMLRCLHPKDKLSFERLETASYVDTIHDRGNLVLAKFDAYIVSGYRDTKSAQAFTDSFVQKNKDPFFSKYTYYTLTIYKSSDKTNIKNLSDNPRDLDRYSQVNNRLYEYRWVQGNFFNRYKIKNGEIIEPKSDIKIEDIPDSTK